MKKMQKMQTGKARKGNFLRKGIAALLLIAMVTALAACSGTNGGESTQGTAAPTEAQTEPSTAAETAQESGTQEGGQTDEQGTAGTEQETDSQAEASSNILVIYFSVPETDGVDTVAGSSRVAADGEVLGNNQYVAQIIARETGGDLFRIETVQEYPGSHEPLLEFAHNEGTENARPELSPQLGDISGYDIIFLGYPIWNADLPMPLYTFLEENDLGGKTIVPFTVHGGSGFAGTIQTVAELQPDAEVLESDSLSISRSDAADAESEVVSWVESLEVLQ